MSVRASRIRWGVITAAVLVVVACGPSGDEEETSTTTTPTATTPSASAPTTKATTTEPMTVEITTVVSWVQKWLDDQFARSEPPAGVTGAYQVECEETGLIDVGGVFACVGVPRTEPDVQLEPVGVVIYVLDESGTAVWSAGTDVPDSTDRLLEDYGRATKGLSCRDLMAPDIEAFPFGGIGRPDEDAFFWSMVYWSLEGEPAGMDEDGDGVPCGTLHDADLVATVLQGGPVPLSTRD